MNWNKFLFYFTNRCPYCHSRNVKPWDLRFSICKDCGKKIDNNSFEEVKK